MENVYYQPVLSKEEWEDGLLNSFDVYRDYKNAKRDFPNHIIGVYYDDDIEEPNFIDDDLTTNYYVDIPQIDGEEWLSVAVFKTRGEAIKFIQETFKGDEEGRISLISY